MTFPLRTHFAFSPTPGKSQGSGLDLTLNIHICMHDGSHMYSAFEAVVAHIPQNQCYMVARYNTYENQRGANINAAMMTSRKISVSGES